MMRRRLVCKCLVTAPSYWLPAVQMLFHATAFQRLYQATVYLSPIFPSVCLFSTVSALYGALWHALASACSLRQRAAKRPVRIHCFWRVRARVVSCMQCILPAASWCHAPSATRAQASALASHHRSPSSRVVYRAVTSIPAPSHGAP